MALGSNAHAGYTGWRENHERAHTGNGHATRLEMWFRGTNVGYIDATGLYVNGTAVTPNVINDDIIFALGTDSDVAHVLNSAGLTSNTALTGVLVGTPVTPAIAANSGIFSNVTAEGDLLFAVNHGGNSNAVIFVDADGSLVFYEPTTGTSSLNISSAGFQTTDAKLGFYGVTPIVRALLATGASHTVDDVITALQNLGLVRQS